jgi:hypothetical protein
VPLHVTRLIAPLAVDYSASRRLVVDYSALRRLVVDYFGSAAHPGASTRRAARHAAHRAARRRLLHVARLVMRLVASPIVDYFDNAAHPCLSTSRGWSRGSLPTTSTMPRVRVPRHIARLVTPPAVDYSALRRLVIYYFDNVARPGASARRAARRAACRRLLRLAQARR